MEKLKPVLAIIKKYHFWVLCVVCIAATLYSWNKAAQHVEKDFGVNKQKVAAKFNSVTKLGSRKQFVNENWANQASGNAGTVQVVGIRGRCVQLRHRIRRRGYSDPSTFVMSRCRTGNAWELR